MTCNNTHSHSHHQLMEYEVRKREQVVMLLRLGEDQTALRQAIQSGDTDLIHTVLYRLRQKLSSAEFQVGHFSVYFFVLLIQLWVVSSCWNYSHVH